MKNVLESINKLEIDKIWATNFTEEEAYYRIRGFFLNHKDYTHLVLLSDDATATNENLRVLLKDVMLLDPPMIGGVCNVDMYKDKDKAAVTRNIPKELWIDGQREYDFYTFDDLEKLAQDVFQVGFQGWPLTWIRRDIVELIPFRGDNILNKTPIGYSFDVTYANDMAKHGIPMYVDRTVRLEHLKGEPGSDIIFVNKRYSKMTYDPYLGQKQVIYERMGKDFDLVVDIVLHNEEDNIIDCLCSLQKIPDIDYVNIIDGSWSKDEPRSIDRTIDLIRGFKNGVFQIRYTSMKWKSESEKRNFGYKFSEAKSKDRDVWHFTIDADEEIILAKGVKYLLLKPMLQVLKHDYVLLESGPHDDNMKHPLEYFQVRLWRGSKGVHWHTGKPMVLHDGECKEVMDWGTHKLYQDVHWIKNLQILNKWDYRSPQRIKDTISERSKRVIEQECVYRNNTNTDNKENAG